MTYPRCHPRRCSTIRRSRRSSEATRSGSAGATWPRSPPRCARRPSARRRRRPPSSPICSPRVSGIPRPPATSRHGGRAIGSRGGGRGWPGPPGSASSPRSASGPRPPLRSLVRVRRRPPSCRVPPVMRCGTRSRSSHPSTSPSASRRRRASPTMRGPAGLGHLRAQAGRPAPRRPAAPRAPADDHQSDGTGGSEHDRGEGDDTSPPGAVRGGDDADGRGDLVGPPAAEAPTSRDPAPPDGPGDDGEPPPVPGGRGSRPTGAPTTTDSVGRGVSGRRRSAAGAAPGPGRATR